MTVARTRSLAEARTRVNRVRSYRADGHTAPRTPRATRVPVPSPHASDRGARATSLALTAAQLETLSAPPIGLARARVRDWGFIARPPWWLWAGLLLNIAAWTSSWGRIGPWNFTFFPLWFGFILVLDGLNVTRQGSSILSRNWRRFALLFPISSVYWWTFEWMNSFVQNWFYIYDQHYSWLTLNLLSTLYFSTVLPAVMEMFELLATIPALKPALAAVQPGVRLSGGAAARLLMFGVLLLWLPIAFPTFAYMLIWFSLIFLLDPINNLAGRPSAFGRLLARDWKFILTLPLAGLLCGFFWEMWNFYALPKWQYFLPYLNWTPHYFEMPIPGLLGYLPFAFELFAMYQFGLLALGLARDALNY